MAFAAKLRAQVEGGSRAKQMGESKEPESGGTGASFHFQKKINSVMTGGAAHAPTATTATALTLASIASGVTGVTLTSESPEWDEWTSESEIYNIPLWSSFSSHVSERTDTKSKQVATMKTIASDRWDTMVLPSVNEIFPGGIDDDDMVEDEESDCHQSDFDLDDWNQDAESPKAQWSNMESMGKSLSELGNNGVPESRGTSKSSSNSIDSTGSLELADVLHPSAMYELPHMDVNDMISDASTNEDS
jgi:hypothetical protein